MWKTRCITGNDASQGVVLEAQAVHKHGTLLTEHMTSLYSAATAPMHQDMRERGVLLQLLMFGAISNDSRSKKSLQDLPGFTLHIPVALNPDSEP